MNLAERNLVEIENRIDSIIKNLQLINTSANLKLVSQSPPLDPSDLSSELADLFEAKSHQQLILSDEMKTDIRNLLNGYPKRSDFKEYRPSNVLFKNGTKIQLVSPYYLLKGVGGKKGKGLLPAIIILGIYKHCNYGLCSYISQMCSALSSYAEVCNLLKSKGMKLNVKTIISISRQMATQARLSQQADSYIVEFCKGRSIVISIDGGRVRLREKKRGPKTAKKRNRFKGQWREVKLFVIYIVDEKGNKTKHQLPIIDGLIGSPEAVFSLLKQYLSNIDLSAFEHIVFIADGAPWIWKRAKDLLSELGLKDMKLTEVLDYYHAMEHLNKLAKAIHKKPRLQKKWLKECKVLLHDGDVSGFIKKLEDDTKGRRAKKIKTEKNYFINNKERLGYKAAKDNGLPQGSGSIESSIRRVVNLRMKGNSIFWLEQSANDMLFLRSYYKSGRWDELEKMAYQGGLQIAA